MDNTEEEEKVAIVEMEGEAVNSESLPQSKEEDTKATYKSFKYVPRAMILSYYLLHHAQRSTTFLIIHNSKPKAN